MQNQGIYQILNLENNKSYYGSSLNLKRRLYEHKRLLKLGAHENKHLQSSWNKYGEDYFEFKIIEIVPVIEDEEENNRNLRNKETEYIQKYQTYKPEFGYNFIPGGIGTQNLPCSEEKKRKISEANKGREAYNKGVPMSDEQKALLKQINEEKYGKAIDVYTLNGVFIETLPSVRETSRKYKVGRNTVQDCCNNLTNPKNLIFRFHGDSIDTVGSNKKEITRLGTEESAKKYRASHGKAIDVYNHLGEYITTYAAVVEVHEKLNLSESTIRRSLKEGCLSGGYFFRYKGEPLGNIEIKTSAKSAINSPTIYYVTKNEEYFTSVKYKKDIEYIAYKREKAKLQRLLKELININDEVSYHEYKIKLKLAPSTSNSSSTPRQLNENNIEGISNDANGKT